MIFDTVLLDEPEQIVVITFVMSLYIAFSYIMLLRLRKRRKIRSYKSYILKNELYNNLNKLDNKNILYKDLLDNLELYDNDLIKSIIINYKKHRE